jgi:hypothetical protein
MKNKLFYHGLPYPFRQRSHIKAPKDLTKLIHQQTGKTITELKNILRWEDDGGLIIQTPEAVII